MIFEGIRVSLTSYSVFLARLKTLHYGRIFLERVLRVDFLSRSSATPFYLDR
jgi:hypothetical protein